ncbi:MAG: DUF4124 domain-containing protein [Agarilytica sp.]
MNTLITRVLPIAGALLLSSLTVPSYADAYYRWTSDDGVIHYGSRPPEGVKAELVNTWGNPAGENRGGDSSKNGKASSKTHTEKQQALIAERKQQCEDERTRLSALRSSGHRIKMEQEDGSSRYLTPEEVGEEISKSEDFVTQACDG